MSQAADYDWRAAQVCDALFEDLLDDLLGSTWRWQIWRAPAAVAAQAKHQPLQWKRGTVQR